MTSGEISQANFVSTFVTGPIPIYTGSCPAWYRTLHPHTVLACRSHRVHTASSEICNAALKYVLLLWNMYCRSKICIAALKYVMMHQNIYCHSEICYPDGMHTFANHHYTVQYGHHNDLVPAPRPPTGFSPCATVCTHPAKCFELAQNFRRVSPADNGPPTCSPIAQRPAVCPHRVPPSARNLPHGGTR